MVIAWPIPLCGESGATTTTVPSPRTASTRLRIPGAVMPSSLVTRMMVSASEWETSWDSVTGRKGICGRVAKVGPARCDLRFKKTSPVAAYRAPIADEIENDNPNSRRGRILPRGQLFITGELTYHGAHPWHGQHLVGAFKWQKEIQRQNHQLEFENGVHDVVHHEIVGKQHNQRKSASTDKKGRHQASADIGKRQQKYPKQIHDAISQTAKIGAHQGTDN